MILKRTMGEKIFGVIDALFLIILSLCCLYPMIYVLFASLSDSNLLMSHSGIIYKPIGFSLQAYSKVFSNKMIFTGYKNTLFILVFGLAINMIFTTLGAYFLSRRDVYFRKIITFFIVLTMYFSGGLVPTYLTVRSVGLYNTLWAVIIPTAINTYNMIILRTGFYSIPPSLEEAATIDGASTLTILIRILIPLIKPTLAVIALYYAVGNWNSWFYASIYLQDRIKYPLQLILREILISNDTTTMTTSAGAADVEEIGKTIKYATIIISTLPVLFCYPFLQRYFVNGVMIGAVKE